MSKSALLVTDKFHSEDRDDDPGKKDLLGNIPGTVTNESQAWGSVIEEGTLRGVGFPGTYPEMEM